MRKQMNGCLMATLVLSSGLLIGHAQAENNLWSKPAVRQGALGAAAGAALGVMSDRTSVGKGAATGAVVGVGTGLMTQSKYLKDKPVLRNAAQGAVIGTGASYATGRNKLEGAALGAGAGVGYRYLKQYIDKR